jgi:hypothetical protein
VNSRHLTAMPMLAGIPAIGDESGAQREAACQELINDK